MYMTDFLTTPKQEREGPFFSPYIRSNAVKLNVESEKQKRNLQPGWLEFL